MDAEIITTGTEILLGEIVDTNAAWMARRLRELGINLYYKTSVGDNEGRIAAVMKQALERSDLALVSGGLGPTVDDVTRNAAARAAGQELVLNRESLAGIETIFARWGRQVHDNNRRQALMPAGARPIPNPVGTAPGFIVEVSRSGRPPALLICLPGVPREMKHLMLESVEPFLAERLGAGRVIIKAYTLRTVGMGESAIDDRIADLMQGSNPTVGLAAHMGQVDVRVTARAASPEGADSLIEETAQDIRRRLGNAVFAEGEDTLEPLEAVVARALQAAGHTLALVETNTGGDIAQRLQGAQGESPVVQVHYALTALAALGVGAPDEIASPEAADWAVQRLWEQPELRQSASLVVAACGTSDPAAGPYGAYRGKTYMSLRAGDEFSRHRVDVGGVDELARRWAGNAVLNWLRLWLARGSS